MEDRTPRTPVSVSLGTKLPARRFEGRSFTTTLFREPIFRRTTLLCGHFHSSGSITAWVDWKFDEELLLSWGRGQR